MEIKSISGAGVVGAFPRVCRRSKQVIGRRRELQVLGASGARSPSAPPAAFTAPEAWTPAAQGSRLPPGDATSQGKNLKFFKMTFCNFLTKLQA